MGPNFEFREQVREFNSMGVALNGQNHMVIELGGCASLALSSGKTKRGLRCLSGVLLMPHLHPHQMIYARRVKVTVGDTGFSTYLGKNGGFYVQGLPEGDHPLLLGYDPERRVKTGRELKIKALMARRDEDRSLGRSNRRERPRLRSSEYRRRGEFVAG